MRCNEVVRELAAPTGELDASGLSEHLAPEHLGTAGVAAHPSEQVDLEPFELELLLQVGEALIQT